MSGDADALWFRTWLSFQCLVGAYKKTREGLFSGACIGRKRRNVFRLKEGRFRFHIRKKHLIERMVRHWNRLSC